MSEKKIFVSQDVKKFLGYEVGSRLHDDWKEDNRPKDENARQGYEARWKPAKTDGYVPGPGLEEVVREVDGVLEIDIDNMSFEGLSGHWENDNLEAGKTALALVIRKIAKEGSIGFDEIMGFSNEDMEELGDAIHEAWMARTEKGDWNKEQFVPYSELPRGEQEKDLKHVKVTMQTLKEILTGELTMEEIRAKFAEMDKAKSQQH